MPGRSVKIAISLPREAYRAMEAIRRRRKTTRSALVAEAIERWLSALDREQDVRRYIEAYARMPETPEELAVSRQLWEISGANEEWS
ncbi:MAG: ribbon-helix-helix protein, CopG family [Candidatus Rokubacteria bacterium]|nr:ribbon-helix-helix protein, CopG family [Candidatus Rokubacteria bacterium]